MSRIIFLLIIGVGIYYWWRSQQIKEKAYQAALTRCYEADVELLDGSVALTKQGFSKDKNGRKHWLRVYQFEFTSTREHRYKGRVTMAGFHVMDVDMDAFHIN